jgi:DNA-binding MarR family transcriptional regulator
MDYCRESLTDLFVNTFRSVIKAEQRWIKAYMPEDLSLSEINVIHKIGKKEITMTELAHLLDITLSSLTTAIDKLVKKGYADRTRSDTDRRIVLVYLTEKGRKVSHIHDSFRKAMIEEIVKYLPEAEVKTFAGIVDRLRDFFAQPEFNANIETYGGDE